MAVGAGVVLAVAGVVGTALKISSRRKARATVAKGQASSRSKDLEAEAISRMDAEGGAMQPVTPHVGSA